MKMTDNSLNRRQALRTAIAGTMTLTAVSTMNGQEASANLSPPDTMAPPAGQEYVPENDYPYFDSQK